MAALEPGNSPRSAGKRLPSRQLVLAGDTPMSLEWLRRGRNDLAACRAVHVRDAMGPVITTMGGDYFYGCGLSVETLCSASSPVSDFKARRVECFGAITGDGAK